MKVQSKISGEYGQSVEFSMESFVDIVVDYGDKMVVQFMGNFNVFIEKYGKWVDFISAFNNREIIIDERTRKFFEADREMVS